MEAPETFYAKTPDGLHIAYQVLGSGPFDLVYTPGWVFNVDAAWDLPGYGAFLGALSRISRVIVFDRRGSGLSDRPIAAESLALEFGVEDLRAVMDAVDSTSAVLFGFEDGGMLTTMFAAADPDRVTALVLFAPWATLKQSDDYPWGWNEEEISEWERRDAEEWGTTANASWNLSMSAPGREHDETFVRAMARFFRAAASPGAIRAVDRMHRSIDARPVLDSVHVPTLVLQRSDDRMGELGEARYIAGRIAGASLIELPGNEHAPWLGDVDSVVRSIRDFVSSLDEERALIDRVLATVLFTDIVGSTERAASLGDAAWKDLVERHHHVVRTMLSRYQGTEIDTAGDGFFATFEGPARAILCAQAMVGALEPMEIQIRSGIHTGEVESIDGKVGGLAVVIGARVAARAGASDVLVSQTVKDLVAGSGLGFEDAGEHELKGVPDRWHLYRVVS